jgi:hypothetical protein
MAEGRDRLRADVERTIAAHWARLRATIDEQRPQTPQEYREWYAELTALLAKWRSLDSPSDAP